MRLMLDPFGCLGRGAAVAATCQSRCACSTASAARHPGTAGQLGRGHRGGAPPAAPAAAAGCQLPAAQPAAWGPGPRRWCGAAFRCSAERSLARAAEAAEAGCSSSSRQQGAAPQPGCATSSSAEAALCWQAAQLRATQRCGLTCLISWLIFTGTCSSHGSALAATLATEKGKPGHAATCFA